MDVKDEASQVTKNNDITDINLGKESKGCIWRIASVILLIAMVMNLTAINKRLKHIEKSLAETNAAVGGIDSTIMSTMANINNQVADTLKTQGTFLADFSYNVEEYNKERQTIVLGIQAIPKEYTKGLTMTLLVTPEGDGAFEKQAEETDGKFYASIILPICDEVNISVTLEHNGVRKTEALETIYDIKERATLDINGFDFNGNITAEKTIGRDNDERAYFNNEIDGDFVLQIDKDIKKGNNKIEKIECVLLCYGKPYATYEYNGMTDAQNRPYIRIKDTVKQPEGTEMMLCAIVTDTYGITYKCSLPIFHSGEKGLKTGEIFRRTEHGDNVEYGY